MIEFVITSQIVYIDQNIQLCIGRRPTVAIPAQRARNLTCLFPEIGAFRRRLIKKMLLNCGGRFAFRCHDLINNLIGNTKEQFRLKR